MSINPAVLWAAKQQEHDYILEIAHGEKKNAMSTIKLQLNNCCIPAEKIPPHSVMVKVFRISPTQQLQNRIAVHLLTQVHTKPSWLAFDPKKE